MIMKKVISFQLFKVYTIWGYDTRLFPLQWFHYSTEKKMYHLFTNFGTAWIQPVSNSLTLLFFLFTKPTFLFPTGLSTFAGVPFSMHILQRPSSVCLLFVLLWVSAVNCSPALEAMLSYLHLVTFWLFLPCHLHLERIIMGEIFMDSCLTVLYAGASNPIFFFIYFVNITLK